MLEPWAYLWYCYVNGISLRSCLDAAEDAVFIPGERDELARMLNTFLLQKAVYELGYELNNRPDWVIISASYYEVLFLRRSCRHDRRT